MATPPLPRVLPPDPPRGVEDAKRYGLWQQRRANVDQVSTMMETSAHPLWRADRIESSLWRDKPRTLRK
jgi:hypothetical protein